MIRELIHATLTLLLMVCLLFGVAFLTACTPVKYITDCTLIQPDNCN